MPKNRTLRPGAPYPLGATWDGKGVNFAVVAPAATSVDLCLFANRDAPRAREQLPLPELTDGVWHGYLPNAAPGLIYGLRAHGPHVPQIGMRFNPHKLLVDPYARAICQNNRFDDTLFGYRRAGTDPDLTLDPRDSAPFAPRCVVVDPAFDWGDDAPPATPLAQSVIYELQVKGYTMRHPAVPPEQRGTYAGLAHPEVVRYIKELGVTAIELLPIHQHFSEPFLHERGLTNYWGYNTLGFLAPDARFSASGDTGGQVAEFKQLVKTYHAAGIEVLLDVVYNHTCEAGHDGMTLSLRGLDPDYYKPNPANPRYLIDFTGCGNSVEANGRFGLRLIMDSLRYWVQEMHVDGFRFDLTSTLGRDPHDFDQHAGFFTAVQQDPALARVKLIAEPWDAAGGGYQIGNYPPGWSEWNGQFRDTLRRYWRGDELTTAELTSRMAGSPDLYQAAGRRPTASINFVTSHDGFTLSDIVSFAEKHNEANGEQNRDGENNNYSFNSGAEGPSDDPQINALRERQRRNLLASIILAQGVPMLLAGDEFGRTQHGNNNAYCQDNDLSWIDWSAAEANPDLLGFVRNLLTIRRRYPALRPAHYGSAVQQWFRPDGEPLSVLEQTHGPASALQLLTHDPQHAATLLLLLNAHDSAISFTPPEDAPLEWQVLAASAPELAPAELIELPPRALLLLVHEPTRVQLPNEEDAHV